MHPVGHLVIARTDNHEVRRWVELPVQGDQVGGRVQAELGCAAGEGGQRLGPRSRQTSLPVSSANRRTPPPPPRWLRVWGRHPPV